MHHYVYVISHILSLEKYNIPDKLIYKIVARFVISTECELKDKAQFKRHNINCETLIV